MTLLPQKTTRTAKSSPYLVAFFVLGLLVLPPAIALLAGYLTERLLYEYRGYDTYRHKLNPDTYYTFGKYRVYDRIFDAQHIQYHPQDSLPPPMDDIAPMYPNAKIFEGDLTVPPEGAQWFYGHLYIHTADDLQSVLSFYRKQPNRNISFTGSNSVRFYREGGNANIMYFNDVSDDTDKALRARYPEIPKDHHIHGILVQSSKR